MSVDTLSMTDKHRHCDSEQCRQIAQTCIGVNLRKASRAVTQLYEEVMRPCGLLPTQFSLLVATRRLGPVSISSLAEALVMDRTTLTRNLKPLERDGFLVVKPGKDDQRSREVTLTTKGLDQLERALPLWKKAQQRMTQELGTDRLNQLLGNLAATVSIAGDK